MNPLVTVLTPCYNSANFITETIQSVINQSYQGWEMIIIDDKSTDNSAEIVALFAAKDSRIKPLLLPKNEGVSNARNKGIALAKGKYIAFLDSDDTWLTDKLAKQVAFMETGKLSMSFLAYHRINEKEEIISGKIQMPTSIGYKKLLWHNLIIFSTSMVLKSAIQSIRFKKVGHEDWVFWLDFFKICDKGYGLNESLVRYRIRKGSVSSNKLKAINRTWRILRESEKLGLFHSIYLFSKYAVATVWKRLK